MIDADQTNFTQQVLEASHDVPVLVDFWASWCAPCRMLGPILERMERASAGRFRLVKVDADDNPELSATYSVRSIPCVVAFVAGEPVDRFVGVQPEGVVRAFIDRLAPDPGPDLRARVRALLAAGQTEQADEVLRVALVLDPGQDDLRALHVRTLLRLQRLDQAASAFAPLLPKADSDLRAAALRMLIDAHRVARVHPELQPLRDAVARTPTEPTPRWLLAQCLMARGDWQQAMDTLLELVRCDRRFGDDAGRRGMMAAFELCEDEQLVREYRRRLAEGLF